MLTYAGHLEKDKKKIAHSYIFFLLQLIIESQVLASARRHLRKYFVKIMVMAVNEENDATFTSFSWLLCEKFRKLAIEISVIVSSISRNARISQT